VGSEAESGSTRKGEGGFTVRLNHCSELREMQRARLMMMSGRLEEHARWRCAPQTTMGLHVTGGSAETV
jgi:hypothetical protein